MQILQLLPASWATVWPLEAAAREVLEVSAAAELNRYCEGEAPEVASPIAMPDAGAAAAFSAFAFRRRL